MRSAEIERFMSRPLMPNDWPKIPHVDQLAAGWAGIGIVPLVLRFAVGRSAGGVRLALSWSLEPLAAIKVLDNPYSMAKVNA